MAAAALGNVGHLLHVRYLIIGGGIAGSSAAAAIRTHDPSGSVLIVGQEVNRPYHRPPLSKGYLRGEIEKSAISALPVPWFEENDIRLVTGRRATHLEPSRRQVTLDDGQTIAFDQCLLAFGGMVAPLEVPGAGLPGLYYLRTLADASSLLNKIKLAVKEGRPHPQGRGRAAVIGGGTLSVEVAASLKQRGLWVELSFSGERLWPKLAGEAVSTWLANWLDHNGVVLHANNRAVALKGNGRVQRVDLTQGETIQCDLTVACVGVRVDHRLLHGTPVATGTRLVCDATCRVEGAPETAGFWAAGDCGSVFDPRFGKHVAGNHWDFARLTGSLAGANMARVAQGQAPQPWDEVAGWHSEVFGIDVFSWGVPRLVERRIVRGGGPVDAPELAEVGLDATGRVCHVLVVGRQAEHAALRKLVEFRATEAEAHHI